MNRKSRNLLQNTQFRANMKQKKMKKYIFKVKLIKENFIFKSFGTWIILNPKEN